MNKLLTLSGCLIVASMLAGCASQPSQSEHFGKSLRHNQYVQVYDPQPLSGPERVLLLDGQKAEGVMESYRTEKADIDIGRLLQDMGAE